MSTITTDICDLQLDRKTEDWHLEISVKRSGSGSEELHNVLLELSKYLDRDVDLLSGLVSKRA